MRIDKYIHFAIQKCIKFNLMSLELVDCDNGEHYNNKTLLTRRQKQKAFRDGQTSIYYVQNGCILRNFFAFFCLIAEVLNYRMHIG